MWVLEIKLWLSGRAASVHNHWVICLVPALGYIYILSYLYMCTYVHIFLCLYICTYIYMCTCVHIFICAYIYICIYVNISHHFSYALGLRKYPNRQVEKSFQKLPDSSLNPLSHSHVSFSWLLYWVNVRCIHNSSTVWVFWMAYPSFFFFFEHALLFLLAFTLGLGRFKEKESYRNKLWSHVLSFCFIAVKVIQV